MPRFKETNSPAQMWLLPASLDEMLPADSDVRLLNEVMNSLDWSSLERSYAKTGRPAYPPRVMAKILVYAYSRGIRSSRRIEELVECDLRYMWLAQGLKPDFHTIARFRKEKFSEIGELFVSSVRLCAEAGLILMKKVAIDGTKIEANASKKSLYDEERLAREREAIEKILREAEAVDEAEDEEYGKSNGRNIPEDMKDAAKRKAKIEEIAKRLKESNRKTISTSDNDARMMKTRAGIRPSFNIQAAVDSEAQVIVAVEVTQNEHDHGRLPDMLEGVRENVGLAPDVVLADTGYSDEETFKALDMTRQEALIPSQEHPSNKRRNDLLSIRCFLRDEMKDILICPAGRELRFKGEYKMGSGTYRQYAACGCRDCSFYKECVPEGRGSKRISVSVISHLRDKIRQKLETPEGRALYARRMQTIEPVFGQIKHNRQFGRFLLRGIKGASAEIALICLVHNLMKCVKGRAKAATYTFYRIIRWWHYMRASIRPSLHQFELCGDSF